MLIKNPRATKKEEEKSYLFIFVMVSFILAGVTAWVIVNETVDRRPWKKYQRQFYQLEYEKLKQNYEKEQANFESTEVQKKYRETKNNLERAWEDFKKPYIQNEYKKLSEEQKALNSELETLRFQAIVARNEGMEKEYLYGKTQNEQIRREIEELEEKGKKFTMKIKDLEGRIASVTSGLAVLRHDVDKYTEELATYTADIERYKMQLKAYRKTNPSLQVYQIYMEDLNVVDRCMSCHSGIDRAEDVSKEQPFASHPDRELYLGNHPPEKFGCVLCHEGQASATSSVKKAHGEVEYWLTPIYRGKTAQASCIRCHNEGREVKGGELLWKGKRLFEELGCYGCHETTGFGEDKNRIIGPSLRNIRNKVKAGWITDWIKAPKKFRPTTLMPDFRLSDEESQAIAAYLWQHADEKKTTDEIPSFNEEQLSQGNFLFEQIGCMACHRYEEDTKRGFAPNLSRIGQKVNYGYLVEWIMNPKAKEPLTRMPGFRLNKEKAHLIATYLMHKTGADTSTVVLPDVRWLEDNELSQAGDVLIKKYGCFSCHEIKGMEGLGKIGAELSAIGSKPVTLFDFGLLEKKILGRAGLRHFTENVGKARQSWLQAKLHDPRQFDEGKYKKLEDRLKMPDFGLQEEEIESLVVFLTGLREEKLPGKYVARLTEKELAIVEGKRLIGKYNCIGCHQLDLDRLRLAGDIETAGMIKLEEDTGIYFQLWEDNERLGYKAGDTIFIDNQQIMETKKAVGGDIVPEIIEYHVENEGLVQEEARVFAPPLLYGEGKKVQPGWLFEFLKDPFDLRPWLNIKMPTFSLPDDEATSIARFFAEIENEAYPFEYIMETKKEYIEAKESMSPGYLLAAKRLFESKDVNCILCHIKGEKMPEGDKTGWAPDLLLARERLKPDWIKRWLLDPQSIQPGTKMPKFFREGEFQDYIPGSPEEQAVVMKDYLMNLLE
ncbi:MAG: c-type cytochrome [Candidatus Brocadia sp.]|jgi:cytochrome c551/c552/nitrate reductase cytochrome c-type subunit